jgi:hypothetical protein
MRTLRTQQFVIARSPTGVTRQSSFSPCYHLQGPEMDCFARNKFGLAMTNQGDDHA